MIYFLIVNYYSTSLVKKLISSIPVNINVEYQVVIVNNSPKDNTIKELESESVFIFDNKDNLGFGGACNQGLEWIYRKDCQAIVWIINPDAYFEEISLEKVKNFFYLHSEVSILGTIIYTPNKKIWFAGGSFVADTGAILTTDLLTNTSAEYVGCDWVSGCSLIVNLNNFCNCPQFDDAYFLYYEDFDFCRRYAKQGYLIAVTKDFGLLHQPSSITNRYIFQKIRHSTYSYLLTLDRYTNNLILITRLVKLAVNAFILIFIRPKTAFGKFYGLLMYGRQVIHRIKIKPLL
ncbi:glycosyltransferase family 2 protein [Rivularia sp. UHCC 0363]|uniref:glycosyltransferase family 2 protein n=1 Tax=Rivularia sp. UHCC 0363 TaxID=3110244 RepID=UPI002B203AAD|nr:glycosyltransferase family 2 protein [Rivularia sp. UHCC 0363]MEA5594375.1 glycosyltransferase family 2 protein [Rivularia sp. UHCC 0363]